jgi:hypothetical protein
MNRSIPVIEGTANWFARHASIGYHIRVTVVSGGPFAGR